MKTAEFQTLLRNYRGVIASMQIGPVYMSFDSAYFNYFDEDDEIQFLLAGQGGLISVKGVESYEKIPDDEIYELKMDDPDGYFEGTVTGYVAILSDGTELTVYCNNPRNHPLQ